MSFKVVLAGLLGLIGVLLAIMRPWSKSANRLENAQGVGPAHVPGVPRGEEQILKHGSQEPTSVAGRIAGSVQPV